MLLFGEADFSFTQALSRLRMCPLIATTYDSDPPVSAQSYCNLTNVDATMCHADRRLTTYLENHPITSCAWNFPFNGQDEDDASHVTFLSGTFMSVAQLLTSHYRAKYHGSWEELEFGIALQGDQFTRWSIMQSARRAGFHLDWWDVFNHEEFPGYHPKRGNGENFPVQNARFYVFKLKCHD
eukprot:CAMPEP_0198274924 /NCGR_PEP_ID=MMETSP1447-20131203/62395_1 /TAXON_ID=420782 /ORGANISM="Chaetoceros dichaeta, Strain CCMP1751" /LENGTH=181 /DNA_ID=CAMNT_0043969421 /DNA_START=322 /DNA_END=867 /DNA_ORIENTATION=+